jgi:hypothetical protein
MLLSVFRPRKPEAKKSLLINVRVASVHYTGKMLSNKGRPWEESEAKTRVAPRFVRRAEKASKMPRMSICLSGAAGRMDVTFSEAAATETLPENEPHRVGWRKEESRPGKRRSGKMSTQNGFFLKEFSLPGAARSVTAAL